MTFDVRVTISGLMTWLVDDKDPTKPTKVHVVMPDTTKMKHAHASGHGSHADGDAHAAAGPMQRHFVRLMYDMAYERQGATQFTRDVQCIDLEGRELVFPEALSPKTLNPTLPEGMIDLQAAVGAPPLKRDHLTVKPGTTTTSISRLTLECGQFSEAVPGHHVNVGRVQDAPTITCVHWTIRGVDAASLKLAGVPELYPIGGVVHISIFHATADDLANVDVTTGPIVTDPGEHFAAYYTLFPGFTSNAVCSYTSHPTTNTKCNFVISAEAREGFVRPALPLVLSQQTIFFGLSCAKTSTSVEH